MQLSFDAADRLVELVSTYDELAGSSETRLEASHSLTKRAR